MMQKNFNNYNMGLNIYRKQKGNYCNASQWPSCPQILSKSRGNLISVGLTASKWRGLPLLDQCTAPCMVACTVATSVLVNGAAALELNLLYCQIRPGTASSLASQHSSWVWLRGCSRQGTLPNGLVSCSQSVLNGDSIP